MSEKPLIDPASETVVSLATETKFAPNSTLIELDLRALEPPQPLMKALETVAALPAGTTLRIHTRWRPGLLYAELERRGFIGESKDQSDGSCLTDIRRA